MLMQCLRKLRPRYNAQYFGLRRNYRSIETKITKFIIIVIIISVIYYPHYRCPRYPINRQFYRRTRRSTTKSSFSRRVKLTNDLKSNASSTEEDALPSSSSRTETHHFCRRCGRMFGNKSYPPVLFGRARAARPCLRKPINPIERISNRLSFSLSLDARRGREERDTHVGREKPLLAREGPLGAIILPVGRRRRRE